MHGHHGWHGGGWGWGHHGHHHGWGLGGLGWLIPALLLGRVVSEVVAPRPQPWPSPPPIIPPTPPPTAETWPAASKASATNTSQCTHCQGAVTAQFTFCPHCGQRLKTHACPYCGHTLTTGVTFCTHCGGPTR